MKEICIEKRWFLALSLSLEQKWAENATKNEQTDEDRVKKRTNKRELSGKYNNNNTLMKN